MQSMTYAFRPLISVLFTMCAVSLALTGCSAPRTPKYQKYRQTVQQNAPKNPPPMKRGEYYATHPEGSESDYHFKLGEAYLARGETVKAYREFAHTVQLNAYHQRALLYLAHLFAQTDEDKLLNLVVRRIHQRDPKNVAIREILAARSIRLGHLNKAERQLKGALEYNPHSVVARMGLSIIYQRRGDYRRAIPELQAVLAKEPNHRIILLDLGDCYWKMNQRDKAMKQYEKCLKLSPKSADLRLRVAKLYREAGFLDRAVALYQEARRLAPEDVKIVAELGLTHLAQGDNDAALTCLQEVKRRSKGVITPEVRKYLSAAYLNKGDKARAVAEIEEGLQQSPNETDLRLHLALIYIAQKKYDAAIAQCQQAIKRDPESFAAYFQLARVYEMAGKPDQAISTYKDALRVQPDSYEALNNLAYLYAQSGKNLDQALKLAQKAAKSANQPAVLDTLGFVHYQRKEYDRALEYFTRAKKLSGTDSNATRLYHLALAYHQKGMKEAAVAELNQALKSNPSPDEAREMQRLLEELNKQG